MNIIEAKACKKGDTVTAKNGPYTQIGIVVNKNPHKKGGFWITYEWWIHGIRKTATKRHQSVGIIDEV